MYDFDLKNICEGNLEKISNWLAAIFLAFGPWQILLVAFIGMILPGGNNYGQ